MHAFLVSWALILMSLLTGAGCSLGLGSARADRMSDASLERDFFGLWVTRWDYRSVDDVRDIIRQAGEAGFTDIFWQVRGQADAYYESPYEPWGEELTLSYDEQGKPIDDRRRNLDPGFDPLLHAVREAHARGIRLHAWVNVMPIWKGTKEPIDLRHPFHTHPQWRLRDETGRPQPLTDGYVVFNPVLDEVHDHIVRVIGDIVDRYDIDGVHLDYVRFLSDELDDERLYPGDARSLSLYARQVGDRATPGQINRIRYRQWIRDRITHLVERIGRESLKGHDELLYSVAVWRRPDLARNRYLQDAPRWVEDGTVDLIMPMIYTDDDARFASDLDAWTRAVDRRRIVPGIGAYKHKDSSQTLTQASLGHPRRFVVFACSTIFETPNPGQEDTPEQVRSRTERREALTRFIQRIGG